MALKFAHAFGAHVTQFHDVAEQGSRCASPRRRRGGRDARSRRARETGRQFPFHHRYGFRQPRLNGFLKLLRRNGTMVLVGAPEHPAPVEAFSVIGKRRSLAGSAIGGIAETQRMLDYCAKHGIVSEIERIPNWRQQPMGGCGLDQRRPCWARTWWTKLTAMDPSPTAEATRLTLPERTSPVAKTPGRLVSRR